MTSQLWNSRSENKLQAARPNANGYLWDSQIWWRHWTVSKIKGQM